MKTKQTIGYDGSVRTFRWKRQHIRTIKSHHFKFIHTILTFVLDHVFVLDIECCTLLRQMKYENEVKLAHKHILKLFPSSYMLTRELAELMPNWVRIRIIYCMLLSFMVQTIHVLSLYFSRNRYFTSSIVWTLNDSTNSSTFRARFTISDANQFNR